MSVLFVKWENRAVAVNHIRGESDGSRARLELQHKLKLITDVDLNAILAALSHNVTCQYSAEPQ